MRLDHEGAVALVLTTWFAGLVATTAVIEPTPGVLVLAPRDALLATAVRADVSLLEIGDGFAVLRSDRRGLVRDLYAAGAWIMLPAPNGPSGCLGRTATRG